VKGNKNVRGSDRSNGLSLLKRLAAGALVVAGLARAPIFGQVQQTGDRIADSKPAQSLYRIAGTVTNSITGEVVAGATLTLLAGQPRKVILTAVSDADGHFALDPVAAGKYSLRASRRGYMTTAFDEHDQYSSAIVTGPDQDTEHIPFHLNPGAMIRGVVTDDAGEPVEQANVLLMRKTKFGGMGEHLVKSISGVTDDTGLFEFWNLVPGTYLLAVKAEPWFALHPRLTAENDVAGDGQREAVAALDVAYPVTYYGGVTDEAAVTPIPIASGDRVDADVTLHAVPAVHLTLHMTEGMLGHRGFEMLPSLHQTVFGEQDFSPVSFPQPGLPGQGLMEFRGMAPGHYSVMQGDPPRVTEIDTTGNQELDTSSGAPTFSVDMKIRMSDGSAPPSQLNMTLLSDDTLLRRITARLMGGSEVHFGSVPLGKWNVLADSTGLWLGVVSIQTGTTATSDNRIVVKDRRLSLTAVVAQGKTSIEGFANRNGKGEAGVMVVLIPKDPGASLEEFRRDQSDSDGSFLLQNVTPGQYTVVAIENGWDLDWARPEVISRYLQGGTVVTIGEKSGPSIRLSAPIVIQMR
jgi:hypothetical protein